MKKQLSFSCVQVSGADVGHLIAMIDRARQVSWETFSRNTNWRELASAMGYEIGNGGDLHLKDDWSVTFYSSRYKGIRCYFMKHSAIEYVFI